MFRKRCKDMLKEFMKRHGNPTRVYVACDCPRSDIWRLTLDSQYKANRANTRISKEGNEVWGEVFKHANEVLTQTVSQEALCILRVAHAEADDCVAVCCDKLTAESDDELCIHVVTGDSDLYQLESNRNVIVWDRKGNRWRDRLKGVDPKSYIQAKCYAGDSADGIPSVGTRIGLKTALGWVTGTKAWPKDSTRINQERLTLNQQLILFSRIPDKIRESICAVLRV